MIKSTAPLLPPWCVPNAPIDLKMAMMTPDQIRAFVREEAAAGRGAYVDLFAAAARALGPDSPEGRHVCDRRRTVIDDPDTHVDTSVCYDHLAGGHFISSHGFVDGGDDFVRNPEQGTRPGKPTIADLAGAHEHAVLEFARRDGEAKAKKATEQPASVASA